MYDRLLVKHISTLPHLGSCPTHSECPFVEPIEWLKPNFEPRADGLTIITK